MTPASSSPKRRRRYTRQPTDGALTLTPQRYALLGYVAAYRVASLPQLARLTELSPKAARRGLRVLFDNGLVLAHPVARIALADPTSINDASLLAGSAPNVYTLTAAGARALLEFTGDTEFRRAARVGPLNSLFVAHQLFVRDVRAWLDLTARKHPNHRLVTWRDEGEAAIDLHRVQPPKVVRPDAWFVYAAGERRLVGLVETDRATERGERRWSEKLTAYEALFGSGRLRQVTGYANARVLVITPDAKRRDRLTQLIETGSPQVATRFWLAERSVLETRDFRSPAWRNAGNPSLRPLLTAEQLDLAK